MKENLFCTIRDRYDLRHQSIAAAAAGMASYSELDKRCITFTIHLDDPARHEPLCRTLFDTIEEFFTNLRSKKPKVSHCGLASFLDVNGSKFSGADRDHRQNHCHGCIFIPHLTNRQEVACLMRIVAATALAFEGVKIGPNTVHLAVFDRNRATATLVDWIGYAQKEATRFGTVGTFGVFLPFDIRYDLGAIAAKQIIGRRDVILETLGGTEGFKVYLTSRAHASAGPQPSNISSNQSIHLRHNLRTSSELQTETLQYERYS